MSNANEVSVAYEPRPQFQAFHARSTRFGCMVAHRRAGKTVACVNELVARATYSKKKRPRYAYIGPFIKQAKKIAWEYLKEYTQGMTSKKPNESELTVRLAHNDAEVCIYGADNPDSFRGQYFDGVVLDEFGDMAPSVWGTVLLPTLADRKGWAVFIGTPKGKNHFYKIYKRAVEEPHWFSYMLKASESGLLSAEELGIQRAEMTEDEYAQEYECSFDAAVKGTYYAKLISLAESEGRAPSALAEHDPDFPVFIFMDLGYTDSTAIWYWQERPDGLAIIDYDEAHSEPLSFYFQVIRSKPYQYDTIWLPHDARAKSLQTGRSIVEQFLAEEFPVRIAPKLSLQDGIDAVRLMLPRCHFSSKCENGVEALRAYRREFDEETKSYRNTPLHDWSSHGSDAFRGLCLVARERIVAPVEATKPELIVRPPEYKLEELFEDRERILRITSRRI